MTNISRLFLAAMLAPLAACAQQSFVERMNARFEKKTPTAGEMLPDVSGIRMDGKPFHLRDTKGKLTVLVTGCLT